jgi:alanyl-tRNA synthetase
VEVGQSATAEIDRIRRERLRKNHTGTHLLHKALRDTLGDHVAQAGSLVAPDRLRFDFNHFAAVADEELFEIERNTAERVIANSDVVTIETSKQEAEKMGAVAFFGDKYGERVRVVKAGDTTEFCGGTHVRSTGQVGPFVLVTEGSVGSNLRRVEALTGIRAYEYMAKLRASLDGIAAELRTHRDNVGTATAALVARSKEQQERIEAFEASQRSAAAGSLIEHAETHGDHKLLVIRQDGLDSDSIRALAHQVRERLGSSIGVVGSVRDGKGTLLAFVTPDIAALGVSAGVMLAPAAKILGGGGGRDPELAQAGGPNGHLMDEALDVARESGRSALLSL